MDDLRELIRQAEAEGRVRRYPMTKPKVVDEQPVRFHPEHCSRGGIVDRAPFLDELDRDAG